jgi:phosphatidylserine decarboxylase
VRIAREGWPALGALTFMTAGSALYSLWMALILFVPLCFTLWFFRDPERSAPEDKNIWVSPADGKVVEIEKSGHPYTGEALKIGIFMNGFNVHVNRFPYAGTVGFIEYVPGKKWFAIAPKASEVNERLYVGAESDAGRFVLVQIAGIMARRISCRVRNGDTLDRGQRYGMIKLGSKVDVYLPPTVKPVVEIGDVVRAGETAIGVL